MYGNETQEDTDASHLDSNGVGVVVGESAANHSLPYALVASTTTCLTSASLMWLSLADDGLAVLSNKLSIFESLVTIYRLNLEAVLSSWSSAITCSYVSYIPELGCSIGHPLPTFCERANRMENFICRLGIGKIASCVRAHRAKEWQVFNKGHMSFCGPVGQRISSTAQSHSRSASQDATGYHSENTLA
jgi:hypothetical protein